MFFRKYRPQIWAELDSAKIRETLGKTILENNWASSYLLIGGRGTGKTTTARLIAKTVNCLNRKKGEEPCNKCDSCLAITNGSSLDVIEIDAASNTGVDDIRDLREKVKLTPTSSKYKVYIIDEVHMLSTSAFNALLKTLEEPPAHVIFILATTDPQKLPVTIISRCLVYDFGLSQEDEIKNKLLKIADLEKLKVSEEVIDLIVKKSSGSHRDAQKIFEQLTAAGANVDLAHLDSLNVNSDQSYSKTILVEILAKKRKASLAELDKFIQSNGKIKDLISAMIFDLRDMLLSGKDVASLINKLIEANSMLKDCPVQSLPLEMVIVEWCEEEQNPPPVIPAKAGIHNIDSGSAPAVTSLVELNAVQEKWPEIVAATKPYNHSLHAFLRAAQPVDVEEGYLVIQVAYKFHKEKLEENKNRDILEKVISDIMGGSIQVKFILGGEK